MRFPRFWESQMRERGRKQKFQSFEWKRIIQIFCPPLSPHQFCSPTGFPLNKNKICLFSFLFWVLFFFFQISFLFSVNFSLFIWPSSLLSLSLSVAHLWLVSPPHIPSFISHFVFFLFQNGWWWWWCKWDCWHSCKNPFSVLQISLSPPPPLFLSLILLSFRLPNLKFRIMGLIKLTL